MKLRVANVVVVVDGLDVILGRRQFFMLMKPRAKAEFKVQGSSLRSK